MSVLTIVTAFVALAAAHSVRQAENITIDAFFYGQSPPVYPSPLGSGTGDWADAYAKAAAFVAQLTQEEKANLTAGYSDTANGCSGNIYPIPHLGYPGICVNDAENGLRSTDFGNSYPSGLHVGASWNKSLALERAEHIGYEFRSKGINILLGPVAGPLGRVATGGRNWEGFANDPYLSGKLVYQTVKGIQSQGVGTCTKHFILNEQELDRNPDTENATTTESVSSNIDDKTLHELYVWPFQEAVLAGSVSIMCSYQRINNSYACQNSATLNGILKTELGFQGFVMTDWGAQHSGVASANAGLDMVQPQANFWGNNLTTAIANGSIEQSRLDDMATRIMAAWYQMGQDAGWDAPSPPGVGIAVSVFEEHPIVNAKSPSAKSVIYSGAVEGHVLVKNTNNALPLKSPKLLSLYGYDGTIASVNNLDYYWPSTTPPQIYGNGTLIVGGGSGTNQPAYISSPYDALAQQAYEDDTSLLWDFVSQDPNVATTSDSAIIFINAYATENYDRLGLADEWSDTLVNNVASKHNNTIVVIHNAGIRLVESFVDHPNVTGIIYAHLPGQESGHALVSLLYGKTSPSGKLPYTVAKKAGDYGDLLYHAEPEVPYTLFPQSDFNEGVYIDYRAFDAQNITPQYEFGFGLSYTTFNYSDLSILTNSSASLAAYPPNATIVEGGNPHLWDEIATVTATVTNTGSVDAAEVAQLYIGIPGGPVRQLRGFEKVFIAAGSSETVSFTLDRKDLSTWDVAAQAWLLQSGDYPLYVGASSRNLPLQSTLSIGGAARRRRVSVH